MNVQNAETFTNLSLPRLRLWSLKFFFNENNHVKYYFSLNPYKKLLNLIALMPTTLLN
jgi:hypothetical protein